jgi:hypothetical protein
VAILGAGDGDGGGREVEQDVGAGEGGAGARGDRHPHVLADLDVDRQVGQVGGAEDEVRAEGDVPVLVGAGPVRAGEHRAAGVVTAGEPALLVELAVVGQVDLGHDAEDLAAVQDDGAVVEAGPAADRGAHDDDRAQLGGGPGQVDDRLASTASRRTSWRSRSSMA